mmetsp:Transcript_17275/g.44025  ORF Transcript_17275/g.44025 Transcript_17275/m.44025 type:complete len:442 (+) Transcript_17275:34-1359(+)
MNISLLIFWSSWFCSIAARFTLTSLSTQDIINQVAPSFGIDGNGDVSVKLLLEPAIKPKIFAVYTSSQWENIQNYISYYRYEDPELCYFPSLYRIEVNGDDESFDFKLDYSSEFEFVLLNCDRSKLYIEAEIEVLNEGSHISSDDGPIFLMSLLLICGHITLLTFLVLAMRYKRENSSPLHVLLFFLVALKTFELFLLLVYFVIYSLTGFQIQAIEYLRIIVNCICDSSSIASVLVLSLGWCLLRPFVTTMEKAVICVSIVLAFLSWVTYSSCSPDGKVCPTLMLPLLMCKLLVCFATTVFVNSQLEQCKSNLLQLPPDRSRELEMAKKYEFFMSLRIIFLSFILIPIIFTFLSITFPKHKRFWILEIFYQCCYFTFVAAIVMLFNPLRNCALAVPPPGENETWLGYSFRYFFTDEMELDDNFNVYVNNIGLMGLNIDDDE